jgi:hypothetical protein
MNEHSVHPFGLLVAPDKSVGLVTGFPKDSPHLADYQEQLAMNGKHQAMTLLVKCYCGFKA